MRAIVVLALLGSVAHAEPTRVVVSVDGWVTPAPEAPLPTGVPAGLDTLMIPTSDVWFQFAALEHDETCADFQRSAPGTRIEAWAGYPADLADRSAYSDVGVSGCIEAGGRAIRFRFFSPSAAELDLGVARRAVAALRDAFVRAGMKVTLPASGLAIELPTHAFTVRRDTTPELGGDADVLVHSDGTTLVKIAARAQRCAERWPAAGTLHEDRVPNGAAAAFGAFRVDDPKAPHRAFLCVDRRPRSVMVEIVEPLAARDDVAAALAALAYALPPDDGIHVAPPPPVHEGFAYLMVLLRIYVEGDIARTSYTSASGGRLGIEAVAGGKVGTHLALGFGAAGGIDENLHASFDLHVKGGISHALAEHSGLFLMGLAGLARSALHGDGTTGGYLGGELDLRVEYVEVAGGVTLRGQHARIEVIKRRREQSFGVAAGGEWIHDGPVQTFGLYLAGAL